MTRKGIKKKKKKKRKKIIFNNLSLFTCLVVSPQSSWLLFILFLFFFFFYFVCCHKKKIGRLKRENKKNCFKGFSVIGTYRSGIGDRGGSMKGKGPHEGGGHLVVYRTPSWYYLGARHARHCLERLLLGGMILTNRQTDYNALSSGGEETSMIIIVLVLLFIHLYHVWWIVFY